jgi:hypothetical protein
MATKDKGGSKSRKKARGEDPQTRAPDQEVEPIGRDCEVVRRIRVDDATRACTCRAPGEQACPGCGDPGPGVIGVHLEGDRRWRRSFASSTTTR